MARESQEDIAWGHFLQQHQNSPRAEAFAKSFYGPVTELAKVADDFVNLLDIDKSSGRHLDLIGSIVGASRILSEGITLAYFGFASQPSGRGFNKARMRTEGDPLTQSYEAPDTEYRTLIKAKIALNNAHGTATEIAEAAKIAFRAPTASARDAGMGAIELWVGRIPSVDEALGRVIPGFLPRAAGISISIVFWEPSLPFGFANFNHFGFGVGVMSRTPSS